MSSCIPVRVARAVQRVSLCCPSAQRPPPRLETAHGIINKLVGLSFDAHPVVTSRPMTSVSQLDARPTNKAAAAVVRGSLQRPKENGKAVWAVAVGDGAVVVYKYNYTMYKFENKPVASYALPTLS